MEHVQDRPLGPASPQGLPPRAGGPRGSGLQRHSCGLSRGQEIVDDEFDRLDALGQAEQVRRGEVTSRALVERAIARIEALDSPINAVVTRVFERALAEAEGEPPDGPFRGVPFVLKGLNDLAGVRTTPRS